MDVSNKDSDHVVMSNDDIKIIHDKIDLMRARYNDMNREIRQNYMITLMLYGIIMIIMLMNNYF